MDALDAHPAGWYPDPRNPTCVRWWTGKRWTGYVTRPMYGMLPPPPVMQRSSSRGLLALLVGSIDERSCRDAACARAVDGRFQHWASDLGRRATKLSAGADFTKAALVSAQRYATCMASH